MIKGAIFDLDGTLLDSMFIWDTIGEEYHQKALEHLGTEKSDTYVFEDMLFALNTAKTDGFPTVGIYDRHEAHQDELKELSDYYIRDFTDPILKTI